MTQHSRNPSPHKVTQGLDFLFQPRTIAVAGVSSNPADPGRERFIRPFIEFGFEGSIYPINPKGGEIMGMKIIENIQTIPGPVDYVVASIPSKQSVQFVRDCGEKGVKAIHFFTSGFGETGIEADSQLETELVQAAREGGVRIIGPNCMGIYCPGSHMSFWPDFPKESGSVGYICQSGGNAIQMVQVSAPRGVRFSKVISFGNAADLNESDYLEYLTDDPETKIIALYIEGVKEGKRFTRALAAAASKKPVILLKGGMSDNGARAVASHTGALAGSNATWESLCKQLGVILVSSLEELTDMLVTFLFMIPPQGRNAAIVGVGGGASVLATDDCERNGLSVPQLPSELRQKLLEFTPQAGNSVRNPIDSQVLIYTPDRFVDTMEIVSGWQGIDIMISLIGSTDVFQRRMGKNAMYDLIVQTMMKSSAASSKPVAIVVQPGIRPEMYEDAFNAQRQFVAAGYPVFPTVAAAANSISKLFEYNQAQARHIKQPISRKEKKSR
ncbi:MAG: CoA-binding protein [Chloroflexota bacterium]|nr:CoA-binding protein [Chloroflexota bacterium]